jgi:hypothetical protein
MPIAQAPPDWKKKRCEIDDATYLNTTSRASLATLIEAQSAEMALTTGASPTFDHCYRGLVNVSRVVGQHAAVVVNDSLLAHRLGVIGDGSGFSRLASS